MKIVQELQSPDVTALKPKVIAAEIEAIARDRMHFRQLLRENRDLVDKPGDYVDFTYRYGTPVFTKVATKLTEVSYYTIGYSSVRLTVEKWGGKLKFAREDLEAASRDVLAESLFEAGLDWAEQVDKECKFALMGAVESTAVDLNDDSNGVVTLPAGTQLVHIIEITGSATAYSSADWYDGKIELAAPPVKGSSVVTVKYYHSTLPSNHYLKAYSEGNFKFRDLQNLRNAIRSDRFNATVAVMHPEAIRDLLLDTEVKFVDASVYGAREPILNGEIGKAGGLKLLDTTYIDAHIAIAVDPDHAGRIVIKKELESTRRDMPWIYGLEYDLWAFFKAGLIRKKAVSVVVNVGGTFKSW